MLRQCLNVTYLEDKITPAIFGLVEIVGDLANPAIIVSVDHGPRRIVFLDFAIDPSIKILVFSLLAN